MASALPPVGLTQISSNFQVRKTTVSVPDAVKDQPPKLDNQPQEQVTLSRLPEAPLEISSPATATITPETETSPLLNAPATLLMEPVAELEAGETVQGGGVLATMSRALAAKGSSDAHWSSALEAFGDLPLEDKMAAGKRAFYTQASMLPQFAETRESLPPEMQTKLPGMLMRAKEAGELDGPQLEAMVKDWSESNPEAAYMAQMSGFADYAGEQLVNAAVEQKVSSFDQLKLGPREEALSKLNSHSNSYVADRGDFLNGAYKLHSEGHGELAQQLLNS
jgi:hypothetical protein